MKKEVKTSFKEVSSNYGIEYVHKEKKLNDFAFQPLLLRKVSENGPAIAVGDMNGDQLEDFIVGNSFGDSPTLFFQTADSKFIIKKLFDSQTMSDNETESMVLFDLENDGDLDLYLVSGGGYYNKEKTNLEDRLFINDGLGFFTMKSLENPINTNGSVVVKNDFDNDGFVDLFVGARNIPGQYPLADKSYLIKNNKGILDAQEAQFIEAFKDLQMVSDAKWIDIDGDKDEDLVIVGEFSPIQIFINEDGRFSKLENKVLNNTSGLWRCVESFDRDGDLDLLVGNIGRNNAYNINSETPMELYVKDIDDNGVVDPVVFTYQKNEDNQIEQYPIHFWNTMNQQSPFFRQKFSTYKEFSKTTKEKYLEDQVFKNVKIYSVNEDQSIFIENLGEGEFRYTALPKEAQLAPVNAIYSEEKAHLGQRLFLVGNDFGGNPFEGNDDAFNGLVIDGEQFQSNQFSGFRVDGVGSDIKKIKLSNGKKLVLVTQNQSRLLAFELN